MAAGSSVTFANPLGEWLAPVLLALRSIGFFEPAFFLPVTIFLSIPVSIAVERSVASRTPRGLVEGHRYVWRAVRWAVCFLMLASAAVALKTMILEEMDYPEPVWFSAYVSPLHWYIASVAVGDLWLVGRPSWSGRDWVCAAYVQVGLVLGYGLATYRIVYEPFSLTDVTTGFGGAVLAAIFALVNIDLLRGRSPARAEPVSDSHAV